MKDSQPERVTECSPERESVWVNVRAAHSKRVCQSKSVIDTFGSNAPPEPAGLSCQDVGHRVTHMCAHKRHKHTNIHTVRFVTDTHIFT